MYLVAILLILPIACKGTGSNESPLDADILDQNYIDALKLPDDYLEDESERRLRRSLLSVNDEDPPTLVRKDCFSWYSERMTGVLKIYTPKDKGPLSNPRVIFFELEPKVAKAPESDCSKAKSKSLSLSFKGNNSVSVDMKLVFDIRVRQYWQLDESKTEIKVSAVLDGQSVTKNFKLTKTEMTAGDSFSFSCSSLSLRSPRVTTEKPESLDLLISRFQVQPFNDTARSGKVFADSFDCSTWFTIPLWTGFFVMILYTAILSFGVLALLDIKTPDRFENPKGKTITVNASD